MMNRELLDYWRPIFDALDPWRIVRPEEISKLYEERPDRPSRLLARRLRMSPSPQDIKFVLCGARGSGKTTELNRLAHDVGSEYCVVHVDLAAGLPEEAGTLAIVTLLGAAALHATGVWSRPDGPAEAEVVRSGSQRLEDALRGFGAVAVSVAGLVKSAVPVISLFDAPSGAAAQATAVGASALADSTRAAADLRRTLGRGPLGGRVPLERMDDAQAVIDAVNGILTGLTQLSGRTPLLLADGLDKRTDLDEVRLALGDADLLRGLAAPLVLTGPINLRHDPRFKGLPGEFQLCVLNNVSVRRREPDGQSLPNPEGIQTLLSLYERRAAMFKLPPDIMDAAALTQAAELSSGIMREFLELLQWASENALDDSKRRIEKAQMEQAVRRRRITLQGYLNDQSLAILQRVLEKGTMPANPEADVLLFENIIACYANGDLWFRPHETLVEFVEEHARDGS